MWGLVRWDVAASWRRLREWISWSTTLPSATRTTRQVDSTKASAPGIKIGTGLRALDYQVRAAKDLPGVLTVTQALAAPSAWLCGGGRGMSQAAAGTVPAPSKAASIASATCRGPTASGFDG